MLITRDDIQCIGDEETLLHFLEEKLNVPVPEGATLAQIAVPLPLAFLGLEESIAEHIIDCQEFRGLFTDRLDVREPFLIRFRRAQNYPEILRHIAEGLSRKNINPAEIFFICTDENFQPFAFAHFNNSGKQDWSVEVLDIFIWAQQNTRISTGSEHEFSVLFSSEEPEDPPETENTYQNYKGYTDDSHPSEDLLVKLQKTGTPLGRHRDINIHTGVNLGYKNAFVIDEYTREELAKDSNSADLIEHFPDKPGKWRWELRNVIYMPSSKNRSWPWSGRRAESEAERIFKKNHPAISEHMNDYKGRLKKETNSVVFYWEFPPRNILRELEHPKIIYRTNATSMQAAYDTSHRFLLSSTHFIPTEDLSLLAILNSKLFDWYAHRKCKSPKYKPLSFSKQNMVKAPIAPRTESQKTELSGLVQQILDDPYNFEVPDIAQEIDELIYELYELTEAEIELIEEEPNP